MRKLAKDSEIEDLDKLPDEKLLEALRNNKGKIQYCPSCGTLTAFLGIPGEDGVSECHECGHSEKV